MPALYGRDNISVTQDLSVYNQSRKEKLQMHRDDNNIKHGTVLKVIPLDQFDS